MKFFEALTFVDHFGGSDGAILDECELFGCEFRLEISLQDDDTIFDA